MGHDHRDLVLDLHGYMARCLHNFWGSSTNMDESLSIDPRQGDGHDKGNKITKSILATAALFATVIAAPASALNVVSINFASAGAATNVNSFARSSEGLTVTATSRRFFLAPGSLTNLTETTAVGQIRRSTIGIGINGGASNEQLDTNNPGTALAPLREGILLAGNQDFSLRGMQLSFVDNNDTLKIYGVRANGTLDALGFGTSLTPAGGGTIIGGLNGSITGLVFNAGLNAGTASFSLSAPTSYYTRYLFTTRIGGDVVFGDLGQGYRIDSLVAGIPEPQTWGLMIVGFGMVGVAARRRNRAVAA
jgi:hypothetical protein